MRAFAWFVAALLLAAAALAVFAYPGYLLAAHLGAWPFHRVAGRIAMLILALELVWLARHLGIRSKRDFGYGLPRRRFVVQAALWALAGTATAAAGAAFLLDARLRVAAPGFVPAPATLAHLLAGGLASGIAVALIEETVFRGALHAAIARESGTAAAVLLTAPLFAVLHFFAKASIPPAELGWHSGTDLLVRSFAPLGAPSVVGDAFLAWLDQHKGRAVPHAGAHGQHRGGNRPAQRLGAGAARAAGKHRARLLASPRRLGGPFRRLVGLLARAVGGGDRRCAVVHPQRLGTGGAQHALNGPGGSPTR